VNGEVLEVAAEGFLEQRAWKLGGTLGTLAALISGRDLQMDIALDAAFGRLEFVGAVASLKQLQQLDASLSMKGDALESITGTFGLPGLARGPFEILLTARDTGSAHEIGLGASAGEFNANMVLELSGAFTDTMVTDISAHARGPDFGAVADLLGIKGLASEPFTLDGEFHHDGTETTFREVVLKSNQNSLSVHGRLGNAPDYLGTSVALQLNLQNVAAVAKRFGIHQIQARSASISATLSQESGGLMLQQGYLKLGPDSLRASGALGDLSQLHGSDLEFNATLADLHDLGEFSGISGLPAIPLNVNGRLETSKGMVKVQGLKALTQGGELTAAGTFGPFPGPFDARLDLVLKLGDMRAISDRTSWLPVLPALPLGGSANLQVDSEAVRLDKVVLDSPMVGVRGAASIALNGAAPLSRITAIASGQDLQALGREARIDFLPKLPFKTETQLEIFRDRVHFTRWQLSAGSTTMDNSDSTITFAEGLSGSDLHIKASGADASVLHASLAEILRQPMPFRIQTRLRPANGALEIPQLSGHCAGMDFDASGRLKLSAGLVNSELEFSLSTPSLANTLAFVLADTVPDNPARASGVIAVGPEGFAIRDVRASVGQDKMTVQAEYTLGTPAQARLDIDSDALDLDRILSVWALVDGKESAGPAKDGRVIPDVALPVAWVSSLQGEAAINVRELKFKDRVFTSVTGSGAAHSGKVRLGPLRANFGGGSLEVSINAETLDGEVKGELAVSARDIRPGVLTSAVTVAERPPSDIALQLSGQGSTLRQLAATASGQISLTMGPGIYDDASALLTSDVLTQLLGAINPFKQENAATKFECGLLVLDARDGILDSQIIMLQTTPTLTGAVARIDLRTEKLELIFNVMARQGLGLSMSSIANPYIKIAGTLGNPSVTFAPTRAAISYGAAVATGGLSIVLKGFVDRLRSGGRVCEAELKKRNLRLPGSGI